MGEIGEGGIRGGVKGEGGFGEGGFGEGGFEEI